MFDYVVNLEAKISIRGMILDYIKIDLFTVVVEFYATILFTFNKMYSVGKIDKNQITNE